MPTKGFFIKMLVKDIELIPSIIDLVDNSVDGALRIRGGESYAGLVVTVETQKEFFSIVDNCGGIEIDLAENYAFRFGREEETTALESSVGQFGVGMKRALFKLGNHFRIESTTRHSRFVIDVDVEKWRQDADNWSFPFQERLVGPFPDEKTGTKVVVAELQSGVSSEFDNEFFRNKLLHMIQEEHQTAMNQGLSIIVNGIELTPTQSYLHQSPKLKPAHLRLTIGTGPSAVTVRIYAGVAKSNPESAGWYLYCNGREILSADHSAITGWGEGADKVIPKFHNQYAMFRGYTYLESRDGRQLPWNTTKTGVEVESPLYRAVRQNMIALMRPIIDYLNKLDIEKTNPDATIRPLQEAFESAKPVSLAEIETQTPFVYPEQTPEGMPRQRITYSKPLKEFDRVRKSLKATTAKEVGEKTFEYYMEAECEE